jgi:hypothetical protein
MYLLAVSSCGGSDGPGQGSGLPVGSLQTNPGTGKLFKVEANEGGDANAMKVVSVLWGRLVDVYDLDPSTGQPLAEARFTDFLIGDDIQSDGVDFELERNAFTGKDELTILHVFGTAGYKAAFDQLEQGLQPFLVKGLTSTLPPYTQVARNGAIAVVFDDLLKDGGDPGDAGWPGTVKSSNVKLQVGSPPTTNFEYRAIPDPNHGDLIDGQFHSTRVILDLAVTALESQSSGAPVNTLGLPGSANKNAINAVIRFPTKLNTASGQNEILTNLTGHGVASGGNGPVDATSPTFDVVRAFRSGGKTSVTQDPYDGFLTDNTPPRVVGSQAIFLGNLVAQSATSFVADVTFATVACALAPQNGDSIQIAGVLLEVVSPGTPPNGGLSQGVGVRVVSGPPSSVVPGPGELRTLFDPAKGHVPGCFVRFTPTPLSPPTAGVFPESSLQVTFSEPMNPERIEAFTNFRLINPLNVPSKPLEDLLAANITSSGDLTRFATEPATPFSHTLGTAESYELQILSGFHSATDLAGNSLGVSFPTVSFQIEPQQPTLLTGSFALSLDTLDEDNNGSGEIRGQIVYEPENLGIAPRAVTRFSRYVDPSGPAPVVAAMPLSSTLPTYVQPEISPFSKYGSRLQVLWRYFDLGFTLYGTHSGTPASFDDASFNLDVEGLSWMPFGTTLATDQFPDFQIELAHSAFLPDESVDIKSMQAISPNSGLVAPFATNEFETPTVVHPRQKGYTIQPLDAFSTPSQSVMMPYPLNRDAPLSEYVYWTFRDTAVLGGSAPGGPGAPPSIEFAFDPQSSKTPIYEAGMVPTIGLPMLMQFRNVSASSTTMINRLATADPSAGDPLLRPYFRAFSEGGVLSDNTTIKYVDPYLNSVAEGALIGGVPTSGIDDKFYFGQADFVVRVNHAHTIWFNSGGQSDWATAVIEPVASAQPNGTQVQVHYRGAANVTTLAQYSNLANYDPYGDPRSGTFVVSFLNGDGTWKADANEISGAQFVQLRLTMLSNPISLVRPRVFGLGVSWAR